ncbi:hypothetical protein ACFE04_022766 [Oxalis oulophora]
MGRSPCCEKVGLKKGPWTPEEDQKLLTFIEEHGHGSWRALPSKAGLQRCGKSCRLRWINYLRPDIKRGKFSLQEEQTIIQLHALLGNRWSAIATHLPKRTDNEIKNYWNTHLKKRLIKMGIDPVTHKPKMDSFSSSSSSATKNVANLSHMAQWESARLEAEARLVRESKQNQPPQQTRLGSNINQHMSRVARPPRPQCLDVLKAWQGVVSGMFGVAPTDLESPMSTLDFPTLPVSGNNIDHQYGTCKENNNNGVMHEMATYNTDCAWFNEGNEDGTVSNIMESLADILGCSNNNNNNNNNNGENLNGGCGGSIITNTEETKSYWDNVLNLVISSPSESAVF